MPLLLRRLFCAALLSFATATLLSACGQDGSQQGAQQAVPVTTMQLQPRAVPFVLETVGRTEGSREVEVHARVSGILEKRLYSEGSVVRAGAALFRIDPAPFRIALDQARGALAEEQARNHQAHRNAERIKELLAQNLVSRSDADNAVSTMEASDAAILVAKANVRQAELNLSYTDVTAPIGGITGRALHSEGSLVTAGTDSSLLTTVTQADPIWARFALSSAEFDSLRSATDTTTALHVELFHKDGTPYTDKGKVNFASSTVDPTLGTVQLRAAFPNKQLTLLPGEYVRVRLSGGTQKAITAPQTAVLQGEQGPFVWIVDANGTAQQRAIKTGAWVGDDWRVNEGLQAGEVVILDNLLKLRPGTKVKPTSATPAQTEPGK